jgi:hypothetical protein
MADINVNVNSMDLLATVINPTIITQINIVANPVDLLSTVINPTITTANISVNPVNLLATVINPTIITEAIIICSTIDNSLTCLTPTSYGLSLVKVSFVGVRKNKSSYLLVDFTAKVSTTSEYSGKYKILEYMWYFDYGRDTNTYEVSTTPTITHKYIGYVGKTFNVKCSVILKLI